MIRADYLHNPNNLPDYYDTMCLDGYSPVQILLAAHRTAYKNYLAQQEQEPEEYTVNINSNVSVKK